MMITARQAKLMVPEGIMNVVVEVLVNQRVLMATPGLVRVSLVGVTEMRGWIWDSEIFSE
jgi:hypothetical protein